MKRSTLYALMTLTITSTSTFNVPVVSAKEREKEQYENYIKTFGNSVFGHWKLQTKVYEYPSNEVLPIVEKKYFKTTVTEYITEVDNIIPSAKYEIGLRKDGKTNVDIIYLNGCNKTNASTWEQYKKDLELLLGAPQNNLDIKTYNIRAYIGKIEDKERYIYNTTINSGTYSNIGKDYLNTYNSGGWGSGQSYLVLDIAALKDLLELKYKNALNNSVEGHRYSNRFYAAFYATNLVPTYGTEEERRAHFEGAYTLNLNGKVVKNVPAQAGRGSIHDHLGTILGSYGESGGWYLKIGSEDVKNQSSVTSSVTYSGGQGLTSMGVSAYISMSVSDHWKEDNRKTQDLATTLITEEIRETDDKKLGLIKDRLRSDSIKIYIYNGDEVTDTNSESSLIHIWNYFNYNKDSYLVTIAGNTDGAAILDNLLEGPDGSIGAISTGLTNFSNNSEKTRVIDFILSKTAKQERNTDWFLLGDEIVYKLKYDDTEHDLPLNFGDIRKEHEISPDDILVDIWGVALESVYTQEKILAEKWRYRHNPDFYDNSMGIVPFDDSWVNTPMRNLDKVGLYRINYKRRDNPLYPDGNLQHTFNNYRYWSEDYDSK